MGYYNYVIAVEVTVRSGLINNGKEMTYIPESVVGVCSTLTAARDFLRDHEWLKKHFPYTMREGEWCVDCDTNENHVTFREGKQFDTAKPWYIDRHYVRFRYYMVRNLDERSNVS